MKNLNSLEPKLTKKINCSKMLVFLKIDVQNGRKEDSKKNKLTNTF